MLNGNGKLSSVSTTNMSRRDGDVLVRTNKLHTRVPLLVWGSSLKFAFLY